MPNDTSFYVASLTDAEVFIDLPALRQYGDYTCGATCVQMLMNWLDPYAADLNLTQYENLLGTTPESGTPPSAIMAYLEKMTLLSQHPSSYPWTTCCKSWLRDIPF